MQHTNGTVDFSSLVNGNLISPEEIPHNAPLGPHIYDAPELPEEAELTAKEQRQADTTGGFLADYVAFAKTASPMTPTEFHINAALSMVSIAVARRLHIRVGVTKIYPNLYTLFVGESTLHRKTTGLSVATGLLEQTGMIPTFTLADRQTPEAFIEDMALSVPRTYDSWTDAGKDTWLRRRSLSAQRGWFLDEASHLLDSFNRDYSSGLLPIVLDVYDSKDRSGERQTKSYGSESIEKAYLTIFGCTTFEAMTEHMSKATHWRNGFFARFALVTSRETTEWEFWPAPIDYPYDLTEKLRYIAFGLFGRPPHAQVVDHQAEDGKPAYRNVEVAPLPDHSAQFGEGAWQAWERYAKAVGHNMLHRAKQDNSIDQMLFANYGRLPTMMIKVAMLFAVMDAEHLPIVIEARHIYAAQVIIESWRKSLHFVRSGGRISAGKVKADEVRAVLAQNGHNYTMRRDLLRALNSTWSEIEQTIKDLESAGDLEVIAHQPKRGPKSEKYRLFRPGEVEETVILS